MINSSKFLLLIFAILFWGCTGQNCPEGINLKPMYGYEKKCKEQIEADTFFLHESDKIDMDRKVACVHEIERAWEYFNTNNLDSSMKRFNQAWLLDSTNADIYWGFGNILGKQQKFQESLKYFDKSLVINSKNSKVWLCSATSYGQLFSQSKDISMLNKAIDNLKESISIDSTNAEAFGQLTALYSYFTQKDSARKYLEITDRLDPKAINPEVRKILNEK